MTNMKGCFPIFNFYRSFEGIWVLGFLHLYWQRHQYLLYNLVCNRLQSSAPWKGCLHLVNWTLSPPTPLGLNFCYHFTRILKNPCLKQASNCKPLLPNASVLSVKLHTKPIMRKKKMYIGISVSICYHSVLTSEQVNIHDHP